MDYGTNNFYKKRALLLRVFQLKSIEIPVLVVGNKVDLTRQVQEEEVQNIQTDWGCTYIGK